MPGSKKTQFLKEMAEIAKSSDASEQKPSTIASSSVPAKVAKPGKGKKSAAPSAETSTKIDAISTQTSIKKPVSPKETVPELRQGGSLQQGKPPTTSRTKRVATKTQPASESSQDDDSGSEGSSQINTGKALTKDEAVKRAKKGTLKGQEHTQAIDLYSD